MSLNDEERITIVELEMEKAKKIFSEIDLLMNARLWSNAANRLYYSVYHAVAALLTKDGYNSASYKGNLIGVFGACYVKTGMFPPDFGRFFRQLRELRMQNDYNCVYDVTPEDLNGKIPLAKELIQRIDDIVSDWLKK